MQKCKFCTKRTTSSLFSSFVEMLGLLVVGLFLVLVIDATDFRKLMHDAAPTMETKPKFEFDRIGNTEYDFISNLNPEDVYLDFCNDIVTESNERLTDIPKGGEDCFEGAMFYTCLYMNKAIQRSLPSKNDCSIEGLAKQCVATEQLFDSPVVKFLKKCRLEQEAITTMGLIMGCNRMQFLQDGREDFYGVLSQNLIPIVQKSQDLGDYPPANAKQ